MYFNSYLFLLLFLPVTTVAYYTLNYLRLQKTAILFLLGMSFWFYGYANSKHLLLLMVGILLNYAVYRLLGWKRILMAECGSFLRKGILFCAVSGNLLILLWYKYYNFFIENWNLVFRSDHNFLNIAIPLGISFITFQQIAFVVDAYRNEVPRYNIWEYALFVAFFPHLSSGPIITHEQFLPLLREPLRKKVNWDRMASGICLFAMGLGKKVLVADLFGEAVNWGYSHIAELNSLSAFFVTVFYTIQIYFDFSGYADMAIGISRMLNLDLPVNFNSPYQALTITDFWNRWHITLTRFFTKYIYIPLGGNRRGKIRMAVNTMIVFLCSGIWHGANWTFVLWGILHGGFVVFTKETKSFWNKIPVMVSRAITLVFVNFTWVLFRADDLKAAKDMFYAVFRGGMGGVNNELAAFFRIFPLSVYENIEGAVWVTVWMATVWIILFNGKNAWVRVENLKYSVGCGVFVAVVLIVSLLNFSGISSFIYFNF